MTQTMSDNNEWVLDIEADNLIDLVTKIHVVVVTSVGTGGSKVFREHGPFKRWVWEAKPSKIIGHNIFGFDLPALRKIWGIPYTVGKIDTFGVRETEFVDTWQLSSFLWPDRPGGHSLDNLARLAGGPLKQDYKGGFEEWSQEMEDYCIQDTKATVSVYKYLLREAREKYGD